MAFTLPRPVVPIAAAAALASASILTLASAPSGAAPTVKDYDCTEAAETFTIPDGVESISVVATGAEGGIGWNESLNDEGEENPTPGGLGGGAAATIPVQAGDEIMVKVGCAGGDAFTDIPASGNDDAPGAAGYGGSTGGTGGQGGDAGSGGGGGGSSDVYVNGTRVLVAAGGGGSGGIGQDDVSFGGDGGGVTGEDGADGDGQGGSSGGQGGQAATFGLGGDNGGDGSATSGGDGGEGNSYGAGGGGGGGWFGGGGGAGSIEGGGGGGGSSYASPSATDPELAAGVQDGDGHVTITYEAGAVEDTEQPATPVPAPAPFTG